MSNQTEKLLEEAKGLLFQGQFLKSEEKTRELLKIDSNNIDGLYIQGVSLRKQNRFVQSQASFSEILRINPKHARTYQERGHVYFSQDKHVKAIAEYEEATKLNSALLASWKALTNLYQIVDFKIGHDRAMQQVRELERLPKELLAVKSHLQEGNIAMADEICRHYLRSNKQDVEGMHLLAEIANKANVLDDAEFILESCLAFDSGHFESRIDYVNILIKRQKFGKANEIAAKLFKENPDNYFIKGLAATTLIGIGETAVAAQMFEEIVEENPDQYKTYLSLGHAYKTLGDLDKSIDAYRQVYQVKPDFGDAFWSLANTKTYKFTDNEIQHMLSYEKKLEVSTVDRVHLCFALGKSYEDQKDYEKAFEFYERGNKLNKEELKYNSPLIVNRVKRQIEVCSQTLFSNRADVGYKAPDPIFIVGLPRAGSTLLEQILASHSLVDGTMELPNILSLAFRLRGRSSKSDNTEPQYPQILHELNDDYFQRFGQQYIEDTRVYRQEAPFFIDKMPNNFVHIGLIKLILPNAKIIDARRNPMACCFSGFKQLFAEGQEFTYGLQEIGTYYREYVKLMNHWDEVLPGYVLRVQHEDVVNDLEGQVRRMLDFCGLDFEVSCVNYHQTERSIRTPSAEQVRQPIYKTGLEQWKNFEPWLSPLIDALGPEVLELYPTID